MEGEAALVTEHVQCLAVRILSRSRIVLTLIEECACFLPGQAVVMKANAVHLDHSGTLLAPERSGLARPQLFQFPNPAIYALDDARRLEFLKQRLRHRVPNRLCVH